MARKGFSVVELMISIAIMGALSAIIITNQSQFEKTVNLRNAAQEIAILFREQQSQATNVLDDNTSTIFNDSDRGIYLDVSDMDNFSFVRFYDEDRDGRFDGGETATEQNIQLNSKYTITEVCANPVSGSAWCTNSTAIGLRVCGTSGNWPTIVYGRPILQPKLWVMKKNSGGCTSDTRLNNRVSDPELKNLTIKVQYKNADDPVSDPYELVVVDATGGIYVE